MNPSETTRARYARYRPLMILILLAILVSTLTRLVLLLRVAGHGDLSAAQITKSFFIGWMYDLASTAYLQLPLALYLGFMGEAVYKRPWRVILPAGLMLLAVVLAFSNLIPVEFNKELHWIIPGLVLLKAGIYLFLAQKTPAYRVKWRSRVTFGMLFLYAAILLLNAFSEFFFWEEFSTRYNFIAVDYLVYTNEVLGNIWESYPMVPLLLVMAGLVSAIVLPFRKSLPAGFQNTPGWKANLLFLGLCLSAPVLSFLFIKSDWKEFSDNKYANEIAGNGLYDFGNAFRHNKLEYAKFYDTLELQEAFDITRRQVAGNDEPVRDGERFAVTHEVKYAQPENRLNVVMISVESLSADFLGVFGNSKHLTPNLDTLATHSLFFSNAYASGTRTVRGLEALSLSIPPPPGQSIVKRKNNKSLFTLGKVFRDKGYITQYIYGGYSYFDNMKDFFGGNGYEVIDRSALAPSEIHYANIWGVADEDLFSLALRTLDQNHQSGKPFFTQIMTVSNHRPYTYPEHRIDIPPSAHSRDGAVKYTDYAIGQFLHEASRRPWFAHTIFVVVADHCASASGKVSLPVTGYHIPLMIYAPAILAPQEITELTAQIDVGPTILGLLHMSYQSHFYGQDMLDNAHPHRHRAFISTYEGLGYLTDSLLVVQSPVRKVTAFRPDFRTGRAEKTTAPDSLVRVAKALYQTSSWQAEQHPGK